MSLNKVNYVNGTTVIMAENLNAIQDEIIANGNAIGTQATAIQNLGTNKADVTALNAEASARAEADTSIEGELDELKSSTNALESDSMTSAKCMDDDSTADLNVTDEDGNVLARFASGEVETKNFASYRSPKTAQTTATGSDLDVIDAGGNVILRLADGHIISKNFDSRTDTRRWVGKKWAAVGDSLTEVNQRTTLHYHDYVAERTGISVVNLGHSGAGYYARPSDYSFQIRAGQVPLDSDVVTIFGSGNDVGKKSLGDVTDTVSADTLCGYINNTFDLLFSRFTTVNLGVITPTPWKNGSNNWTPENPGNAMELYCEAIVEICKRRSIPCLDLYHCSNLRPMDAAFRAAAYSKDEGNGIHPDETGHFLIAARFEAFLDSLLLH